jgi:hypothetical protein
VFQTGKKNASLKHEILKIAFGENAMGRKQNFAWFSQLAYLSGFFFTVLEHLGRPYTGRMKKVWRMSA